VVRKRTEVLISFAASFKIWDVDLSFLAYRCVSYVNSHLLIHLKSGEKDGVADSMPLKYRCHTV
jgi:hypothetical protein